MTRFDPLSDLVRDLSYRSELRQPQLGDVPATAAPVALGPGAAFGASLVSRFSGEPDGAKLMADALREKYGKFGADNRAEILDAIAGIGGAMKYYTDKPMHMLPQAPNETMEKGRGQCQDIHGLMAAVLGALLDGNPSGHSEAVQAVCFATPNETHCYLAYRDPDGSGWGAIEYGKRYEVGAPTALAAVKAQNKTMAGSLRMEIRGWNERPTVIEHTAIDGAWFGDEMARDEGVGKKGELRTTAGTDRVAVTYFLSRATSLTAAIDPRNLRGSAKINWRSGDVRFAGGVAGESFDVRAGVGSTKTESFKVLHLGGRGDVAKSSSLPLAGDHLRLDLGLRGRAFLDLPIHDHDTALATATTIHSSQIAGGGHVGVSGKEARGAFSLAWSFALSGEVDAVQLGAELFTSGGTSARRSLLLDPWRTRGAVSLAYKNVKLDVGANLSFAEPYDQETTPRMGHYAILSLSGESTSAVAGISGSRAAAGVSRRIGKASTVALTANSDGETLDGALSFAGSF